MVKIMVVLNTKGSFEIRKTLNKEDFVVILYDTIRNIPELVKENYEKEEEIPFEILSREKEFEYHCLYNGDELPPQKILKLIKKAKEKDLVKRIRIEIE